MPFVLTISFVGIPAFAIDTLGEYPAFAFIVMYCTPSLISLFCTPVALSEPSFEDPPKTTIPIPIRSALIMMIETVLFIK